MAIAEIGNTISFIREGENFEGVVKVIRENSVIVEFGYSKERNAPLTTVVNHKNYKLKK
ncbi:DUF2187 family protein [Peribacillus alkalitolerans]|uniref:DUF2187 family protein n=1 Tax=Peribacillus alkalitolerans TaxID=1550385 RepID=UPI0013D03167|nr:DUF2187 family protein [Peribacillus alkalitolerans]